MYIIRSRNAISVGKMSLVNLIVEFTVFKLFMNSRGESIPCGQIRKMSSINLFHSLSCREYVYAYFSSNLVMNKLAYKVAN